MTRTVPNTIFDTIADRFATVAEIVRATGLLSSIVRAALADLTAIGALTVVDHAYTRTWTPVSPERVVEILRAS